MFFKGDTIVYATTGVCVIDDIREQACTGEVHTCYVLQPVFDGELEGLCAGRLLRAKDARRAYGRRSRRACPYASRRSRRMD